jgi:hypothetical protein
MHGRFIFGQVLEPAEVISEDVLNWARDLRVIQDVLVARPPGSIALQPRPLASNGAVVSLTAMRGRNTAAAAKKC